MIAPLNMDSIHARLREAQMLERRQLLCPKGIRKRVLDGAAKRPIRTRMNPGDCIDVSEYLAKEAPDAA